MAHRSSPELLVLHGVRVCGVTDAGALARRFRLDRAEVEELLLDHEAYGYVQRASFADVSGWSLTERGRREDERRLADELEATGSRDVVTEAHGEFARLNPRLLDAITKWQVRPTSSDRMARNDHTDWAWDERVLATLTGLGRHLQPLGQRLTSALERFDGYPTRYAAALDRVDKGDRRWVDEPGIDSCHTVWFQLHEDLLATLGLSRGDDT